MGSLNSGDYLGWFNGGGLVQAQEDPVGSLLGLYGGAEESSVGSFLGMFEGDEEPTVTQISSPESAPINAPYVTSNAQPQYVSVPATQEEADEEANNGFLDEYNLKQYLPYAAGFGALILGLVVIGKLSN